MPEWYLVIAALFAGGILGFIWSPLLWSWPLFLASLIIVIVQAAASAKKNISLNPHQRKDPRYKMMITALHIIQPIARLYGRFNHGLTPWRKRGILEKVNIASAFRSSIFLHWSDEWQPAEKWLSRIEEQLYALKTRMKHGGEFDHWDFQVSNGMFSKARGLLTIEDHGAQKQYLKFKCWSFSSPTAWILSLAFILTAVVAFFSLQYVVAAVTSLISLLIIYKCLINQARSVASLHAAFATLAHKDVYIMIQPEVKAKLQHHANGNGHVAKKNGHHKQIEILHSWKQSFDEMESVTDDLNTNKS